MGFAAPAPAAHRPEWRALLALACTAALCALALLVAGRAADQPTTSTKGAQVKAKATAYMNGQPGFILGSDATAFESINFITASSGELSFSFLDEALRGGKCHAISKATGKPISGRMHMLDENDNRAPTVASGQGMRVNFGTTLSYFRTVCDFEESVDAKKEASVSFGGGVSGKIMLALKPMFVGKPAGLAMCQVRGRARAEGEHCLVLRFRWYSAQRLMPFACGAAAWHVPRPQPDSTDTRQGARQPAAADGALDRLHLQAGGLGAQQEARPLLLVRLAPRRREKGRSHCRRNRGHAPSSRVGCTAFATGRLAATRRRRSTTASMHGSTRAS